MSKPIKQYFKNIFVLFVVHFILLLIYRTCQDISCYFNFGMKPIVQNIPFNLYIALFWGSCQTGISAVVLIPFYKAKIKNQYKLLLTWTITFAFSVVWIINNLAFLF